MNSNLLFSVPKKTLAQADKTHQSRWIRYQYPNVKKANDEGVAILFEDEAIFRQDPTLYRTWARIGSQPEITTMGQRNMLKIFGTIELYCARFLYHFQLDVYNPPAYSPQFNALERIWHHTRLHGSHNRYFATQEELHSV